MRLAALGLLHETNTFNPKITGIESFPLMPVGQDQSSILGVITGQQLWHVHAGAKTTVAGFHAADSLPGVDVVPLVFATTPPSGTITREAFEAVWGHMRAALDEQGPFDGILMAQHGASVADGFPDADAEMIRRVREARRPARPDRRRPRHARQHLARPAGSGHDHAPVADQPARRCEGPGPRVRGADRTNRARRDRARPGDREAAGGPQHPAPGHGRRPDAVAARRRARAGSASRAC